MQIRGDVSAGCGDGRVAKVVADNRNIDARLQQGDCAAMAKHVGRNVAQPLRRLTFRCQANVFPQQVGDAVSTQRSASMALENDVIAAFDTNDATQCRCRFLSRVGRSVPCVLYPETAPAEDVPIEGRLGAMSTPH